MSGLHGLDRRWGRILVAAIVVGIVSSGHPVTAASQEAGAASVSAFVLGELSIVPERSLDFGTLVQNAPAPVEVAWDDEAGEQTSGHMRIVGTWNRTVDVTIAERPGELTHEDGTVADVLPLTLNVGYRNDTACADGDPPNDFQGETVSLQLRCDRRGQGGGGPGRADIWLWFWGSIEVGNVTPGTYSTQFTVTAVYN